MTEFKNKGAAFSADQRYRYALWRVWQAEPKCLMVIGLNPSTADAQKDDPTIRRCIGFAVDWGFGGLLMGNLFAFRSTYPHSLSTVDDPVGIDNNEWLMRMRDNAGMVLAAWGANGDFRPQRTAEVLEMFPELYHLGLTQKGHPRHPLYIARAKKPEVLAA